MFETFVVGALPGSKLGVVRQCMDCRAAAGAGAPQCPGFGPGCFLTPRPLTPIKREDTPAAKIP